MASCLGQIIYYNDETHINAGYMKRMVWQDQMTSANDALFKGLSTGLKKNLVYGKVSG